MDYLYGVKRVTSLIFFFAFFIVVLHDALPHSHENDPLFEQHDRETPLSRILDVIYHLDAGAGHFEGFIKQAHVSVSVPADQPCPLFCFHSDFILNAISGQVILAPETTLLAIRPGFSKVIAGRGPPC